LWLCAQPALAENSCSRIEGDYAFTGQVAYGSFPLGSAPNIAAILFPDSEFVHDREIDRYAIDFDAGSVYIEFATPAGPVIRLDLAASQSFSHCTGDALVIEQQRQAIAGSVYEYSRHRHTLRRDADQGLQVETDITGKYQNRLMAWPRERERRSARFDKLTRGRD
jgi:hypothetical protein